MSNNNLGRHLSSIKYIRETDYQKFVELKRSNQLSLSDYTNIWKVILYLLLAQEIQARESRFPFIDRHLKFSQIRQAIDEYYQHAFSPEIINAIQFAEEATKAAELVAKYSLITAKFGNGKKSTTRFTENKYQVNLLYVQKAFEDALASLKLDHSHTLFIDGIDIRPPPIEYDNYLECVKGLANAVWSINSDFFPNIRDSKGRLKVVLLLRPDIFHSLGLQNTNSKLQDNSAMQDWRTTYTTYRSSDLFHLADRVLSYQQEGNLPLGHAWDHYFPYEATNIQTPLPQKTSFLQFLRYSLYRPRDILTMLSIQRENLVEQGRANNGLFSIKDFHDPAFTRKYSDYVLGEVKDHIGFYHSNEEYEIFLKFFQYLYGQSRFTYEEYLEAFAAYQKYIAYNLPMKPGFARTPDLFLQFLYDLNVVGYIANSDDGPFFGWCYRERTPSNIAPKVRHHARYEVHYGLMKALDLGKKLIKNYPQQ